MIISCIKCNKKFAVEDKLIPELGRILQCGSCSHQWHYIPVLVMDKDIPTQKSDDAKKQVDQNTIEENINDQTDQSNFEKNIEVNEPNNFKDEPNYKLWIVNKYIKKNYEVIFQQGERIVLKRKSNL